MHAQTHKCVKEKEICFHGIQTQTEVIINDCVFIKLTELFKTKGGLMVFGGTQLTTLIDIGLLLLMGLPGFLLSSEVLLM